MNMRNILLFAGMALLIVLEGSTTFGGLFGGSWNTALFILNFGLLSAIMALGVNMQWGYAGLFNVGVVGFIALGGLAPVLIATPPVTEVWTTGGVGRLIFALIVGAGVIALAITLNHRLRGKVRLVALCVTLIGGFFLYRALFDPAVEVIEAFNPATNSNLGGLGLPVLLAWPVGAALAAGAAWLIGKTALGLRSDYLAIATLGIGEIIIATLKNEDWLARGVKNVIGIPRPVPYEVDLQSSSGFIEFAARFGADPVVASTIVVKLLYAVLFLVVLLVLITASELALRSPWGRMMRAIRDNEVAAEAMGKNVTGRHLQIFMLGSAVCGLAGAMMVTMDSLHNPGTYNPLRFTFLIWVMVIVGGSGNNWGAMLGGFLISFLWLKVESWGPAGLEYLTSGLDPASPLREHLKDSAAHMRLIALGLVLLLVLRFSPRGLIPEK
ncbi:branched-chain amino acid ABC transporter permease [Defluviimonas sp. WL0002]|uniref:Branched-chain amino acid ABC transporter permease n=1 Tax=Albidovulum marisflavi TaxID=2984159 RepID=A0ABT2ZFY8_9RHOB|nr:branched-chain amino acid ABC transporter permease [Defluviimonas sp. WL0002]MCV2870045.1 branched-chain amino acid ABC transporter permease [Defluviimonas sp. WL0002]